MLEVKGLTKYYKRFCAVDKLSFHVNAGEIVGLLGPNGAGKTSVVRCIANILRYNEGSVRIAGYDLMAQPKLAKSRLAFVPEVPNLYELLTVREHIKFIAMCFDSLSNYERQIDALLARFDLTEKGDELVANLSKGMKQKLAIACALVHDAKVLLFDEPLIGVDPRGAHEVKAQLLQSRDEGCAVLVSTHLLETAERLCDRILILNHGQKVAEGTLEELRSGAHMQSTASLEDIFLKLTEEAVDAGIAVPER